MPQLERSWTRYFGTGYTETEPLAINVTRSDGAAFTPTATITILDSGKNPVVSGASCSCAAGTLPNGTLCSQVSYLWTPPSAGTFEVLFVVVNGSNQTTFVGAAEVLGLP